MSGEGEDRTKALTPRPGYEVGYGKPPRRPGSSRASREPPRPAEGIEEQASGLHEERMKDIILDEAYRDITVRDGDRTVTIPMAQAVIRSLAVNAAKGQHRAQRLFAELLASVESSRKILHDEWLETAIDYKVEWEKELERRARLGSPICPSPCRIPTTSRSTSGRARPISSAPPRRRRGPNTTGSWRAVPTSRRSFVTCGTSAPLPTTRRALR